MGRQARNTPITSRQRARAWTKQEVQSFFTVSCVPQTVEMSLFFPSDGQDEKLKQSFKRHGDNFVLIRKELGDRTESQCLQRWRKVLNPAIVKGAWTQEVRSLPLPIFLVQIRMRPIHPPPYSQEDDKLRDLVAQYGPNNWTIISNFLPGRVNKQCRERCGLFAALSCMLCAGADLVELLATGGTTIWTPMSTRRRSATRSSNALWHYRSSWETSGLRLRNCSLGARIMPSKTSGTRPSSGTWIWILTRRGCMYALCLFSIRSCADSSCLGRATTTRRRERSRGRTVWMTHTTTHSMLCAPSVDLDLRGWAQVVRCLVGTGRPAPTADLWPSSARILSGRQAR